MQSHPTHQLTGKNLRGILFGAGSFAVVSLLASYFISDQARVQLGDEVKFEGWSIALRVPDDWTRDEKVTDLSGADVYIFRPKPNRKWGNDAILRVRRSSKPEFTSAKDYARDVLAQYAAITGFDSLNDALFANAKMGDWSGSLVAVDRDSNPFRNQFGLHVHILAGVSPGIESSFGYSVDLQTVGPITGREQAIWKQVSESIRTVHVLP